MIIMVMLTCLKIKNRYYKVVFELQIKSNLHDLNYPYGAQIFHFLANVTK